MLFPPSISRYTGVNNREEDQQSGCTPWVPLQWFSSSLRRRWLIVSFLLFATLLLWSSSTTSLQHRLTASWPATQKSPAETSAADGVVLVVASMKKDDTSWLRSYRPEWPKRIYVTDDQSAQLTVPSNKGREAMVYLTYIIDYYDVLAPITIFHHAERYQWHNDDPLYDGQRALDRLQLSYVLSQGYVNLRCVWILGCPDEIRPKEEEILEHSFEDRTGSYYAKAFAELFPGEPLPEVVGVSCCSQFAATKEMIKRRSLAEYKRYRDWLLNTEIMDHVSGRILEYSWHIIFGQQAVFCPDAKTCYCKVYGLCQLTCEDARGCRSQYTLPTSATMPAGWPEVGWDGEIRNITKLREGQAAAFSPL